MDEKYKEITGEEFYSLPFDELYRKLRENYNSIFNVDTQSIDWVFKGEGTAKSWAEIQTEAQELAIRESRYIRQGKIGTIAIILGLLMIAGVSLYIMLH